MYSFRVRTGKLSRAEGFTIVELMIVVFIVAVLALAAIPMYTGHVNASKMSEGIAGVGMIRTALRAYAASHGGQYPVLSNANGDQLSVICVNGSDLNGKYFRATDYVVSATTSAYTIRATLPSNADYWYQLDHNGTETKSGF